MGMLWFPQGHDRVRNIITGSWVLLQGHRGGTTGPRKCLYMVGTCSWQGCDWVIRVITPPLQMEGCCSSVMLSTENKEKVILWCFLWCLRWFSFGVSLVFLSVLIPFGFPMNFIVVIPQCSFGVPCPKSF